MDSTSTLENSSCQIFESYAVLENCIKLTFSLSTAFKNNTLSQEYLTICILQKFSPLIEGV